MWLKNHIEIACASFAHPTHWNPIQFNSFHLAFKMFEHTFVWCCCCRIVCASDSSWDAVCICLCRSSACSHSLALAPVLCECALKCGHDSTLIYWFLIIVALLRCGCACSDSVMVFCCFFFFFFFLQSAPYVILHEKKHFFLFSSFDVISRLMHFRSVVAHIFTQCKSISCNLLLLLVLRRLLLLTMTEIKKRNELILICLIDRTKPNQTSQPNGTYVQLMQLKLPILDDRKRVRAF